MEISEPDARTGAVTVTLENNDMLTIRRRPDATRTSVRLWEIQGVHLFGGTVVDMSRVTVWLVRECGLGTIWNSRLFGGQESADRVAEAEKATK